MSLFKKKISIDELFPKNFVDIHSHLLPGIDDGAKTIEDSLYLIEKMMQFGITNFRTTPHVLGSVWENSTTTIKEKEVELKNALLAKGHDTVNLHAAAEYMLDDNFMRLLKANDIIPVKGKYILVEMSYFNPPFNLDDLIFQIGLKGFIPILAHPERYNFFHNDFPQYEKLINAGCLFQLNILSLTDQYGKSVTKMAHQLLKKGMYTFVATDTHHKLHLNLMKSVASKKNKKLLDPLFTNTMDTFSF